MTVVDFTDIATPSGSPKTNTLESLANGVDSVIASWRYKLGLAEHTFARGVKYANPLIFSLRTSTDANQLF